jgi:RND family efflux transporter MFP subunit
MSFIKTHLKTIIIISVTILVAVIGINFFRNKQNNNVTVLNPQKDIVVFPKKDTIKDELTLAGSVDASSKVNLSFQTPGQISWLGVKVGDKVKKYQAVASLNKDQLKKQLEKSFNDYKSSLSTFDDTQDQYETEKENSTLTDEMKRILSRSQNTLNNSVIAYELNDLAIKYATLVTPIAGVVTNMDILSSGINITPASTISIIDPQSIFFKSEIDQEDVVKIKEGDKAVITIDSFPEKSFESKVEYISFVPIAGQSSTVYELRFALPKDNTNLQYRLGMDGDVSILLNEKNNILVVPTDAVQYEGDQAYVYTKNGTSNQLERKNIKTGIETEINTEVIEGLTENDQVVIKK